MIEAITRTDSLICGLPRLHLIAKSDGKAMVLAILLISMDGMITAFGTWSIKGNTVKTYVDGELYVTYEILSLTSTTSELKMSMGDGAIWIKCQKQ